MVSETEKAGKGLNYYVLAGIFISVIIFAVGNTQEPQIDTQIDFFEFSLILAYFAPGVMGYIIAKRYWGSQVFGKAYLALATAFTTTAIGQIIFQHFQLIGVSNPFPSWPDLGYGCFYPLAIYHLWKNIHYFKKKLDRKQKIMLIIFPAGITSIYILALLMPISVVGGVSDLMSNVVNIGGTNYQLVNTNTPNNNYQHIAVDNATYYLVPVSSSDTAYPQNNNKNIVFNLMPLFISNSTINSMTQHDETFWKGFFAGIYYVAGASIAFALAMIGFQVFRGTMLGVAWGLLLVGLGLVSLADMSYYYTSIYFWDRTNPVIAIYVAGCMVTCYALFKHRQHL